jgi:carbon monoxide dehydrogenase subunit G
MEFTHRFSVPTSIDAAWTALANIDRIAPSLPGATISSIQGNDFAGSLKIKFGPVLLLYTGSGSFVERDSRRYRAVIEAHGSDRRGNGTAAATITMTLAEAGLRTEVEVLTKLALTGKPAQYGEGVVRDALDRLCDQFVGDLTPKFAEGIGRRAYTVPGAPEYAAAGAITGGPAAGFGTRYTPPSDTSKTHLEVFNSVAPSLVRRFGKPALGVAVLWWITSKVVRGAKRQNEREALKSGR